MVYADTSFFVSLYIQDVHSKAAENLFNADARLWFTPLHYAEYANAVAQQVFYKNLTVADAHQAYSDLDQDRASGLWVEAPMPESAFNLCADLARRHGPKLGVRTLDSLHVACALELKAERFWTFDERQAKLAKAEGLKIS
ncbi:MAG: type II toxin-antitoxin system VapC family toxin [Acidobacteriia bacterium]|nr:type II toxin-antitoxin system VapC family toxin [Terriglobia bacterium]